MHLESVKTSHSVRHFVQQETVLAAIVQGTEFQDKGAAYGRQDRSEDTLPDGGQAEGSGRHTNKVTQKTRVHTECGLP